jgi:hypothetical protein
MITVKLREIVNNSVDIPENKEEGIKAQKSNLAALQEANLPVKVSYRIKRLIDKCESILKAYNEKRNELVKEFGTKDEAGNFSVKDPEKLAEFFVKLNELLEVEESIEFDKIKVDDLGEITIAPKLLVNFIFE